MPTNASSLLLGTDYWHDGTGTITYSFLDDVFPSYYNTIDTNGDTIADSYEISFLNLFPSVPIGTSVQMDAAEIALTNYAIDQLNAVANLNITLATSGFGDMTFGSHDMTTDQFGTPNTGLYGFAYLPNAATVPSLAGDVWLNTNNPFQAVNELGHTSYNTYLHEIGHALGLYHPNNDPNNTAGDATNNNQFTVMSYVPHPGVTGLGINDQGWPLTPQLYDIEALQSVYGANLTHNTGGTTYFGDGTGANGTYAETGFQFGTDMMVGSYPVILTIWDAGGTDVIDASQFTTAVDIDLNPGAFSTIGSIVDNIALASAVLDGGNVVNYIENAEGGSGNDTILGNSTANVLDGNGGNDTIDGGLGNDTLIGGAGADSLTGGADRDEFLEVGAGDTIDGGTDGNDVDELDLTGLGFFQIVGETVDADGDSTSGTVQFLDGAGGNVTGSLEFREIELLVVCLAEGSLILTPTGETRIEDLCIGDPVRTASGAVVPIRWIGRQTFTPADCSPKVAPVCITAGALGNGLPHSDLYLTADHGMIIDGHVINASALVNGHSIYFVRRADLGETITYYHIETECHDVILANGAESETFLDAAGRNGFDNFQEYLDIYGTERLIPEMSQPRITAQRLLPQELKTRLQIAEPVFAFTA